MCPRRVGICCLLDLGKLFLITVLQFLSDGLIFLILLSELQYRNGLYSRSIQEFSRLQKRCHLLHIGGHVQALGAVGGTRAAADTGGGPLVLGQGA